MSKDKNYDYVTIAATDRANVLQITSKSDFFKQKLHYSVDEYDIKFRISTIDDKKHIVNPCLQQCGFSSTKISVGIHLDIDEIPLGKHYFDEDSTIDEVIINYK